MMAVAIEPPTCPVCDGGGTELAKRGNVTVHGCASCGMIFATGEHARGIASTVVDTDPDYFRGTIASYEQQAAVARRIVPKRLAAYEGIIGRPVRSILEIGCGTGALATAFKESGVDYRAVEIDPDIAAHAVRNTGADITVANFMEYGGATACDVVFASQVFEHIATPKPFLRKVAEHLEDGIVHLDVPNHESLAAVARRYLSSTEYGFIQPPYHMFAYTPKTLRYTLSLGGFRDVRVTPARNDDPVWGQLIVNTSAKDSLNYFVSGLLGRGSLLVALARAPLP